MEYGEAITDQALQRAIQLTQQRRAARQEYLATAATEAVAQAYCVCVADGEDAAEHRFSDVHRDLINEVIDRVRELERARTNSRADEWQWR